MSLSMVHWDMYAASKTPSALYCRVGWGYSVQKRCFFRHFFDFYKDFENNFYLMVSYSWKVVTTHYLSYPSLFGGLKGPPFFYRSWVIRIAPHGASRITLGVLKKKGPLGSLIPKFWLKTMRTCKLTCYLWYGTRSETKKVISTEKLKSISSDQFFIDRREPWLIIIEIWTDLKTNTLKSISWSVLPCAPGVTFK